MKNTNSMNIGFIFIVVVLILILIGDIVIIHNNKENKEKIDNLTNTIMGQNEVVEENESLKKEDEGKEEVEDSIVVDGAEYKDEGELYNDTTKNED